MAEEKQDKYYDEADLEESKEEQLENDELSSEEEGFMTGYEEEGEEGSFEEDFYSDKE